MPDDKNLSALIHQGEPAFPTRIRSDPEQVTERSLSLDQSLERSNDSVNREVLRLREQARMLMERVEQVESETNIRLRIRDAECGFRPVVNQNYFLYENKGLCKLSLVGPEEWNGKPPYGVCLAKVRQLGDLTWEVVEKMNGA